MKYIIERPINGISLNGNEQLLGEDGEMLLFKSEAEAKQFIVDMGNTIEIVEEDLDNCAILINPFEEE
jgi:hypothetical protein